MAKTKVAFLSKRAERDFDDITENSTALFGDTQTIKYMSGLMSLMENLAQSPHFGRPYQSTRIARQYLLTTMLAM